MCKFGERTEEDHDKCLGTLIGIMNACCGHDGYYTPYVQFLDGTTVHGEDATTIQNILKKNSIDYKIDPERNVDIRGESVHIKKNKIWEDSVNGIKN